MSFMPELPEVETLARKLAEILPQKRFSNINVFNEKSFQGSISDLTDLEIVKVWRKAKVIGIDLANDQTIITHLKMTGQLIYLDENIRLGGGHPTADWIRDLPSNHTRIEYIFDDGSQLFFNDQRKFGWMRLIPKDQLAYFFRNTAPDIIDPAINPEYLADRFARKTQAIKQVIMDNAVLAGVGNIYACDSLNLAKISPTRPAKSLTKEEINRLTQSMKQIVARAIELGGTTFDGKYVSIDGLAGGYQDELRVYGKEGELCPNCGDRIEKIKLGGRGTYFCPSCQK